MRRLALLFTLVLPAPLLLEGCISVERSVRYRSLNHTGNDELFRQLVPDRTTRAWLEERLGKPDAVWTEAGGHDVMRYDNVRERRTQVSVFPLVAVDLGDEDVERYYFELAGDRLVRYWRETNSEIEPQASPQASAPAAVDAGVAAAASPTSAAAASGHSLRASAVEIDGH